MLTIKVDKVRFVVVARCSSLRMKVFFVLKPCSVHTHILTHIVKFILKSFNQFKPFLFSFIVFKQVKHCHKVHHEILQGICIKSE